MTMLFHSSFVQGSLAAARNTAAVPYAQQPIAQAHSLPGGLARGRCDSPDFMGWQLQQGACAAFSFFASWSQPLS
jgi:hypothetical protein